MGRYRWCRCTYRHAVAVAAVLLLSCGGGEGGIWISQTVASAQAVEFYNEDDSEDSKDDDDDDVGPTAATATALLIAQQQLTASLENGGGNAGTGGLVWRDLTVLADQAKVLVRPFSGRVPNRQVYVPKRTC
jgi:hypothetical protein